MNSPTEVARLFSFSASLPARSCLPASRGLSGVRATAGLALGNRALMRAWAARRVAMARKIAGVADVKSSPSAPTGAAA